MKPPVRIALCLFLILRTISIYSQDLQKIRVDFHSAETGSEIKSFIEKNRKHTHPLVLSYIGTAEAQLAQHVFSPFKKYNLFKSGTAKIEQSIVNRDNCESRYLRLLVQLNCPKFLGYHNEVEQDIKYIVAHINNENFDTKFKLRILNNIINSGGVNEDLLALVNNVRNKVVAYAK